jgi:hypothetical protein
LYRSTDGYTWVGKAHNLLNVHGLYYFAGKVVRVAYDMSTMFFQSTTDNGVTWVNLTTIPYSVDSDSGIVIGSHFFFKKSDTTGFIYSADLISWSSTATLSPLLSYNSGAWIDFDGTYYVVATIDGKLIVLNTSFSVVYTTPTLLTGGRTFSSVLFKNGVWRAFGTNVGAIYGTTSATGTWTLIASLGAGPNIVAYNGGAWVTNAGGNIRRSTNNCATWDSRDFWSVMPLPSGANLSVNSDGLRALNGLFFWDGFWSTDGGTWYAQSTLSVAGYVFAGGGLVTHTGSVWVILSQGAVFTSASLNGAWVQADGIPILLDVYLGGSGYYGYYEQYSTLGTPFVQWLYGADPFSDAMTALPGTMSAATNIKASDGYLFGVRNNYSGIYPLVLVTSSSVSLLPQPPVTNPLQVVTSGETIVYFSVVNDYYGGTCITSAWCSMDFGLTWGAAEVLEPLVCPGSTAVLRTGIFSLLGVFSATCLPFGIIPCQLFWTNQKGQWEV